MINNQLKPSLVSRFPELVDLLASVEPTKSTHQNSSSAAQLPSSTRDAARGENGGARDPIVIYRDGPFHFIPATLSQPLRIEFGNADREFGLSCIVESMRGGKGPAYADPKSIALYRYAARVARSDANVMITGETGTGKEGMARYIHQHSERAKKPFVTVNCAAITESMIESILFGHKKGAFTGAYNSAVGLFKEADGGTIFLDEITEMPLESQSKLLRVLQEGEILPVGASRHERIDVRVVCAANRDFAEEVGAGRFREDLYWRLNVMPIEIAPLAERPADKQDDVLNGHSARFIRGRDLHSIAKHVEYEAINQTLEKTNGNRRDAAKELGISERTLRYRMADMRALAA